MPLSDTNVTLYIVIVLYKLSPAAAPTYRTLLHSLAEPMAHQPTFRILLYDNTPPASPPFDLAEHVEYFASQANTGLADAYNLAAAKARVEGFDWLLTLDQDTELPVDFISQMTELAHKYASNAEIAAIVPHISAGNRNVSPNWFAGGMFPRWFPKGYHGVPDNPVFAFNSGTLVRISALESVGGYSPLFWLDNCDAYLFRQIEKKHWKVFVAGRIQLQHDFSMLDITNKMSLFRYKNAVEAGSAFFDLEMGRLAGIEHTFRLMRRYLKQFVLRGDNQVRRITATVLIHRLIISKTRRIETWTEGQQRRIESYGEAGKLEEGRS